MNFPFFKTRVYKYAEKGYKNLILYKYLFYGIYRCFYAELHYFNCNLSKMYNLLDCRFKNLLRYINLIRFLHKYLLY